MAVRFFNWVTTLRLPRRLRNAVAREHEPAVANRLLVANLSVEGFFCSLPKIETLFQTVPPFAG